MSAKARRASRRDRELGLARPAPDAYVDVIQWLKDRARLEGNVSLRTAEAYILLAAGCVMVDSHPIRERYVDAVLAPDLTLHTENLANAAG